MVEFCFWKICSKGSPLCHGWASLYTKGWENILDTCAGVPQGVLPMPVWNSIMQRCGMLFAWFWMEWLNGPVRQDWCQMRLWCVTIIQEGFLRSSLFLHCTHSPGNRCKRKSINGQGGVWFHLSCTYSGKSKLWHAYDEVHIKKRSPAWLHGRGRNGQAFLNTSAEMNVGFSWPAVSLTLEGGSLKAVIFLKYVAPYIFPILHMRFLNPTRRVLPWRPANYL